MKGYNILSLIFLVLGIIFLINSKINITGAVTGISFFSSSFSAIFGIALILISITIFIGAENLEKKVSIYETRRGNNRFVEIVGLDEIAPFIQANYKKPVDEYHINLRDLSELLDTTITPEERKKLYEKYGSFFKNRVYEEFKLKLNSNSTEDKREKQVRLKESKESIISEIVLHILDPSYITRREQLKNLKNSYADQPHIFSPIEQGTAVYVRYTSQAEIDDIDAKGVMAGSKQSLYFPSLEEAEKFITKTPVKRVLSMTGASNADKAIVFQTIYVPDKINTLTGAKSKSMPKAFFNDLDKDSCYLFKVYKPPRR